MACRLGHIEAEREGCAGRFALRRKNRIEAAAGAWIDHGLALVWGTRGGSDIFAAAETGIDEALGFQLLQGRGVIGEMLGLAADRFLPVEAEPMQIVIESGFEFRATAGAVDVLDAQQKTPARFARGAMSEQGGMGVAEMEKPCRTRRESRNNLGSEGEGHGGQE